jgi:hypothetical protein
MKYKIFLLILGMLFVFSIISCDDTQESAEKCNIKCLPLSYIYDIQQTPETGLHP